MSHPQETLKGVDKETPRVLIHSGKHPSHNRFLLAHTDTKLSIGVCKLGQGYTIVSFFPEQVDLQTECEESPTPITIILSDETYAFNLTSILVRQWLDRQKPLNPFLHSSDTEKIYTSRRVDLDSGTVKLYDTEAGETDPSQAKDAQHIFDTVKNMGKIFSVKKLLDEAVAFI